MKNKRILIYEFQDLRFASRARKEAFSLAKFYSVELIGYNRTITKKKVSVHSNLTIIEYPIPFKNSKSFLSKSINILFLNIRIGFYIIKEKADIYFMHNLKVFYPSLITKSIHKAKLVYDAHELHMAKRPNKSLKQKLLTKYDILKETILLKRANLIIQASEQRSEYFSNFYNTKKPLTIENFANYIRPKKYNGETIKSILKINTDSKIIIFTGFISYGGNQRIDNVIKSLKYLSDKVHFCVLGFGNENVKNELISIAEENKVLERFHFLPPVLSEEVVPFISQADVAIIPIFATSLNSRYSALNKVSQSLMAGLPLACSNYENLVEIVEENSIGKVGETFNIANPNDIARAITVCLLNRADFSKRALLLARKYINWESQESKLNSEIAELL